MAERQTQWLGTVLLEPRVSHSVLVAVSGLAAVAVLALLLFGSYTRKARLNGWLVPQQGLARVFSPQPGVVTRIHVREGQKVAKGTPLLVTSGEVQTEARGGTREEIVRRLADRRDSVAGAKSVQERLFDQQGAELRQRLEALETERRHLAREIELQRDRVQIGEKALARERAMRARDLIALPRLQRAEEEQLERTARLQSLERSQSALRREYLQVKGSLQELPFRRATQIAETDRSIAALEQELAEAEARRQIVVTAPQDGTVASLQVEPGGSVQPSVPLLSIVPSGSTLQAQLFSPSRAIGFVRPGQEVLLRYQPFPYQKFGFHKGVVASVSRSALSPSELTQQLAGLTSLYGANEPVYRITVALTSQTVTAYGERMPLQPGMQLEADVLIDSRRLIEWVFDPLFTLTGTWRG